MIQNSLVTVIPPAGNEFTPTAGTVPFSDGHQCSLTPSKNVCHSFTAVRAKRARYMQ
jgi:hypothetical protein